MTTGQERPRAVRRARVALTAQVRLVAHLVRWIALGALSGVLAGIAAFVFLSGLDWVTTTRLDHEWLVGLLPLAGLGIGCAQHFLGGRANEGNALLLDQIHEPTEWIPRRMAPLALVGAWATHLFGGSAGREGVGLQMSGSLTDWASRLLRLDQESRRVMLIASLAGGFGAVFGVPLAGAVFALEVQSIGRVRYEALVPALAASIVGSLTVSGLGYEHDVHRQLTPDLTVPLAAKVALAGLAFGLAGLVFVALSHAIKRALLRIVGWHPLRLVIGGIALVSLALVFGTQYCGLSVGLADAALGGSATGFHVFALKLLFTAITLGCFFPGGEVTPLFVIGATLGSALAGPLHVPAPLLAAVGFVAVFAGAANVPLACTIMGAELFGSGVVVPMAVGCVVAYVISTHRSIYPSQRFVVFPGFRRTG